MIESAQWMEAEQQTIKAVIDGKTVYIPAKANNRDYQDVMEWVDLGNSIES